MNNLETTLSNFFKQNTSVAQEFMHDDVYSLEDKEEHVDFADISYELMDNYGGEDMGAEYYSVWKFVKNSETVYIRLGITLATMVLTIKISGL